MELEELMSSILEFLRSHPRKSETGSTTAPDFSNMNLDQIVGYLLSQNWMQQQNQFNTMRGNIGANYGYMPSDLVGDFNKPTAATDLANRQFTEGTRQFDANDSLARFTIAEQTKNQDLDRTLQREVEAGRISQADKDRHVQMAQIESQNKIAQARVDADKAANETNRYGIDVGAKTARERLDLDAGLGWSGEKRNNYLANLQGSETEAGLAANPRDWIKLAFFRANKPMHPELNQFHGPISTPQHLDKGGSVSHGPTISTVGEKDLEYALLAPGSIIAPKGHSKEEPNMRNAISALMNQVMKSGGNVRDFPLEEATLKHAAQGMAVTDIPSIKAYFDTLTPAALASLGLARTSSGYKYKLSYGGWMPVNDQILQQKYAQANATPNTPPIIPPDAPPAETPDSPAADPANPWGDNHPLPDAFKYLATVPFIEQERQNTSPHAYPGLGHPFGAGVEPINPYNAQTFFDMQKANPTDRAMLSGYQSAFGIPDGDTEFTAQQTAEGFNLIPRGARAVFRPLFQ